MLALHSSRLTFHELPLHNSPAQPKRTLNNRANAITALTYPSGRIVNSVYDYAGRLSSLSGTLGDGANRTYSTAILYSPFGGIAKEQFGTTTPIYNKLFYNSRGQLAEIRPGTTYNGPNDTGWERGAIINHYSDYCWGMCSGSSMPDNNGNVKRQDHWIQDSNGNVTAIFEQWYEYDQLNRLKRVYQGTAWQQQYVYDRWGNRTVDQANTWGAGIPKPNFGVDATTNRLTPATGAMNYDAAGNLTNDTYTGQGQRTYDAENRMKQAWATNQWQTYSYDGDGRRIKRVVNGSETWQVYGIGGELLAEYAAGGAPTAPQKEYGYRNGQLLITAEAGSGGGGAQNVSWTNAVGVSVSGNSLTMTAASGWGNAGAASTQSIAAGDGYVETTANQLYTYRMFGLSNGNTNQTYEDIDFALYLAWDNLYIYESGAYRAYVGTYALGDVLRVSVEGGVVKYRKNGTLLYTSTGAPTYPLLVDTALHTNGATLDNVVISGASGGGGSAAQLHWLVTDQLGTPRIILDQIGNLTSRHDYLPFGEELFAGTGGRTTAQGYSASDGVRQKFADKERDYETGLDFSEARYYASMQGRFTSADPFNIALETQKAAELNPQKARALFNAYLSQPQQWNRYSYAINNPLLYVDPDGEAIQLSNDKDERERQMQALREMVGPEAAQYLYVNQGTNPDGSANYYVGIYDQNPNGDTRSFEQVNEVAGELGAIVRDKEIATLEFVPRGTIVKDDTDLVGRRIAEGPNDTPAATGYFDGKLKIKMLDWSKNSLGYLPGQLMSDGKDNWLTPSVMVGHELGHVRARMTGYRDMRGNADANKGSLRLENKVRKLQDPNGPQRKIH